ncbi:MAG TPA: SDR family oxidoreductase [Nitrososphaera sp.]|jgi:NAD(P)-dependent dehydrogenase (short-subunit alcohol dehydrogenase family)|nr:SDR family oxidoreductase [Nitrososphaera sp.]
MIEGKTCLVTGGTSGIGKEIAIGLAKMGSSVVLVGRDKAKCAAVAREITQRLVNHDISVSFLVADLSSQSSIRKMALEFRDEHQHLDILINNAGVFKARYEKTKEGIEYTFAVNHLAPFLLTSLLIDRLKASGNSRVVTTSSIAHRGARIDFEDLQFNRKRYNGIRAYGQSKLANILFTRELARRLDGTSVTTNCFHPGGVRTNLAQDNPWYYRLIWYVATAFLASPEKGADTGIYLASSPELNGITGKYFVKRRDTIPSLAARDQAAALRLWDVSEELTGINSMSNNL